MSVQQRKERERAEREQLIVATARELAETEGWEAVTTRRLADKIEYSQPVLYSHFAGKDAIMAAVAVQGFTELAEQLRAARSSVSEPARALAAVAATYAAFAQERPAVYEVMFIRTVELPFASSAVPAALSTGFEELRQAVWPLTSGEDADMLAETFWAALHGLVSLARSGRLRPDLHRERVALLVKHFSS